MARGRFPTVRLGLKSLLLHKLRSFLTVLGLLFGVSSVIAMLAVGEGASYEALQQLKTLGPTNLMARSQKPPITEQSSQGSGRTAFAYGLKYIDLDRIRATFPHAEHIVAVKETQENLRRGIAWTSAYIVGTEPEYMEVMNLEIAEGRWLSHLDLSHRENCIVLGAGAVARLFPLENPLGKSFQGGSTRFTVIGVLKALGRAASPGGVPLDECVFVPLTTSRSRFGDETRVRRTGVYEKTRVELSEIKLRMRSTRDVVPAAHLLKGMLEIGSRAQDDVKTIVPLELLRQEEATARIFNLVLGSIAVISLLVGGIGIMNVMLATVTERTREIGIRRALGAKKRHIVRQFLVETAVLSGCGGVLGVLVGLLVPTMITALTESMTIIRAEHVLLSFGISAGVGVTFGLYPAWRAANMDPLTALRHE
ncbi:MAG: putative ABC transport system permease protein [Planctomycetota bacterium]|jgi:putative ABC transport system permease protein